MRRGIVAIVLVMMASTACFARTSKSASTSAGAEQPPKAKAKAKAKPSGNTVLDGRAVWYGEDWHGRKTASGEKFDMHAMTAAHRDLPLGAMVKVTNLRNGKAVVVRINDRGPYGKDRRRIIDVSLAAAKRLDFVNAGWTPVTVEVLSRPPKKTKKKTKKGK